MYVACSLQNAQTKEKQDASSGRLKHKRRKMKTFLTHTKDEEGCGEANLRTLSGTDSPYGESSGTDDEWPELREYHNKVSMPLTERNTLLMKLRYLNTHSLKEDDRLHGKFETFKGEICIGKTAENMTAPNPDAENIGEQLKEAEAPQKLLSSVTERGDQPRETTTEAKPVPKVAHIKRGHTRSVMSKRQEDSNHLRTLQLQEGI
jgi:hypothetical protein